MPDNDTRPCHVPDTKVCAVEGCNTTALSFRDKCWEHLLEDEREGAQNGRRWKSLNNIWGVLSNYQSLMEREIIKTRLSPVDVLIHPQVEVYTATDYQHAAAFILLGEEAAERAVDAIKQRVFVEETEGI